MKTIRTFAQCLAFGLFIAAALEAFGMSRRLPSEPPEAPSQPTTPTPVVPREPAAIKDPMVPEGYDPFRGGGEMAARDVDDRYQKYRELQPRRDAGQAWVTDRCDVNLSDRDSFADRIAYAVHLKMRRSIPRVEYVGSLFGMSSDPSTYTPVSLISHPLCMVSRSTLEVTLGGKNIPSQQVIDKANAFASKMNQ
ncbi:MAG: hypothetical protein N2578_10165, partial [Bdellovibrionaceae bacterium]|nr:hypothetical protein [Pseudobdellovibrionaceae bacterium]